MDNEINNFSIGELKMKWTKSEAYANYRKINQVLDSDNNLDFAIVYAVAKNKGKLKQTIEDIDSAIKTANLKLVGLEGTKRREMAETIQNEINDTLRAEEIEFDAHMIDKDKIPKSGPAYVLDICLLFCKE